MAVTQIRGSSAIVDGSIYNAQVNASAAIADTKLATISTAGKVSDSALSANIAYLDGSRHLTADWALSAGSTIKLTGLADPTSAQHAATKSYVDTADATFSKTDGSRAFSAVVSGVTPTLAAHLATKGYVDGVATGLDLKASVRVATTAALTLAADFENGDTVDGVVLATGNRILIKNQASAIANGIYTVNATGAPTRATDADSNTEVTAGMFCFVTEGTANSETGWVLTTNDADIDVGTNALDFTQFNATTAYTAGAGLALSSSSFSVNVDGSTLEITTDTLNVKALGIGTSHLAAGAVTYAKIQNVAATNRLLGRAQAGAGVVEEITVGGDLTQSGSTFTIANAAVTTAKINAGAVTAAKLDSGIAGDGIAFASGVLSVGVDGVGVELSADAVRLKDLGVTTAKLNDAAVTSAKLAAAVAGNGIAGGAGTALSVDFVNVASVSNGSTATFGMTGTPVLSSLQVFQNGLLMSEGGGDDYTVSGTDVIFATIPPNGDKIRICFLK